MGNLSQCINQKVDKIPTNGRWQLGKPRVTNKSLGNCSFIGFVAGKRLRIYKVLLLRRSSKTFQIVMLGICGNPKSEKLTNGNVKFKNIENRKGALQEMFENGL